MTNIAANDLPDSWKPYLWLAWPIALVLAAPAIYVEIRERHQRRGVASAEGGAAGDSGNVGGEQDALLRKAQNDLAVAVRDQWTEEAGARSLRAPEPMRVSLAAVGGSVARELPKVLDPSASEGPPGPICDDISDVARMLRLVRSRQLVILGGPASGKTVTALLLTLDLLSGQPDREADEPVPVLLSVSAWNPHAENLHAWAARRIVEEYPALANSRAYGAEAAMRLVGGKRVIPVLDGLDEMARDLRSAAIVAIDRAVTDQYPLVLTCRTDEYREAVRKSGRMLTHAAAMEIQPGTVEQAMDFLREAIPEPQRWQPVASYLDGNPDSPLARVLSSPLMVDLARTVYGAADNDPADLLCFRDRPAIERHLIGAFLAAAYDQPFVWRQTRSPERYDAGRAGAWLRFLADHAGRLGRPDIAWWHLERAIPRATRGMLAGFAIGLGTGLIEGSLLDPAYGLTLGLTFGLGTGAVVAWGSTRSASRITVRFRGNGRSLLVRGIGGLSIGCGQTAIDGSLGGGLLYGGVLAVALIAHRWLGAPPDVTTEAAPADSLKEDRNAALVFGVVLYAAFMFGCLLFLAFTPEAVIGRAAIFFESMSPTARALSGAVADAGYGVVVGGFLYGRTGAVAYGGAGAIACGLFPHGAPILLSTWDGVLILGTTLSIVTACLGIFSRAWGAYTFARFYLALRGRIPWRLMRFLDDARERGVLRQSGKVYQFRHERLREYLAGSAEPESRFRASPGALRDSDDVTAAARLRM